MLVRHHYLSLDPYMRGRMTDAKNYATLQPLNKVMIGGTVGEVAASKNPAFAVGDPVVGMGGWQLEVWPDALKELGTLVATGKLKYRETVSQGLETAPEPLIGLFKGKNFGKQRVKLV